MQHVLGPVQLHLTDVVQNPRGIPCCGVAAEDVLSLLQLLLDVLHELCREGQQLRSRCDTSTPAHKVRAKIARECVDVWCAIGRKDGLVGLTTFIQPHAMEFLDQIRILPACSSGVLLLTLLFPSSSSPE